MRRLAAVLTLVLPVACFHTPRERAMEEPDRFERFNALAELDSTQVLQAWHPISDPTAALPGTKMPMNQPVDLRTYASFVEQYLASVDEQLQAQGIVPRDGAEVAAWEVQFHAQMPLEPFSGWSIELWAERRVGGGIVERQIRCNVVGMNQLPVSTIAPTLSLRKPAQGIRFDWFVSTGDSLRNEEVLGIIKAQALTF